MNKWELTRYLIDAKKCVDSIIYIDNNSLIIKNINIRKKVNERRDEFYIKCCVVLDNNYKKTKHKRKICCEDEIIRGLYYERDKNSAHKDPDYKGSKYNSYAELVSVMKKQILHVRELCKEILPTNITLDFVPHDDDLFRLIHGLTAEKEEEISNVKYPFKETSNKNDDSSTNVKIFQDTEDIRDIEESEIRDYGVLIENGINNYEGLQKRQDACIKINVLQGKNMWTTANMEAFDIFKQLKEIGFLNEYNIPNMNLLFNPDIKEKVDSIMGELILPSVE